MIDGHRGQSTAKGKEDAPVAVPGAPSQEPEPIPVATEAQKAALRNGFLIGKRLVRLGVTANQVTFVGILLAAVTGV